jgi:hypothetical protein
VQDGRRSTKFSWLADKFTMDEYEGALDHCNNSAPVLDEIKFIKLKFLPEEAKRYLQGLFNEIMITIPESWLRTKIVPKLKPIKDPELSDSYKPISLLPCARRLLEEMLCTRLDF